MKLTIGQKVFFAKMARNAKEAMSVLFYTRGGSLVEQGLGLVSSLVTLAGQGEGFDLGAMVSSSGFERYSGPLEPLLDTLPWSDRIRADLGQGAAEFYPSQAEPSVVFLLHEKTYYVDPAVDLPKVLREYFWRGGRSCDLSCCSGASGFDAVDFRVEAAEPPRPYVGDPSPEFVVDRLSRVPTPDGTRSLLIAGMTGLGKSALAQRVAEQMVGPEGRVLILSRDAYATIRPSAEMLLALGPDALVVNDLDLSESEQFLSSLERIRGVVPLVISTFMDEQDPEPGPGSDYWPGMRPGRVDRVVRLRAPDSRNVRAILASYLGQDPEPELVEASLGFTGAYLGELARRILGGLDWREEVVALRQAAPPSCSRRFTEVLEVDADGLGSVSEKELEAEIEA